MIRRQTRKLDANQAEIVRALCKVGCEVIDLSAVGEGCPDILVLRHGIIRLIEIKNLDGRGRRLTPSQFALHSIWPVSVVATVAEALAAVGL